MIRKFCHLFFMSGLILAMISCAKHPNRPRSTADADSLVQMVKERIAEKKAFDKLLKTELPSDFFEKATDYYPIIRKYAKRYGFDWRLILMQILKESRFKEDARSHVGAVGLMQIMPKTANEIRQEMDIEYIASNPRDNIAAGIYHLYKQLHYFPHADRRNRLELALASYNCGPGRVFDAQDIARYLRLNPNSWEGVKTCLPKLTSKDWRLHLEVWELGVPPYGYFYGYEQTIDYVDDIMRYYIIFRKVY